MLMYIVTIILIGAFIFSILRDRRSLWNPALLISSLIFSYISIAKLLYDLGLNSVSFVFESFSVIMVLIVIFGSALFLVYNGLVLLRREGLSKTNLLSLVMGMMIILFFILVYLNFSSNLFCENVYANILFIIIVYSYLLFGCAFAGFLLYSILYLAIPKKKQYDFIIIHGAGLKEGRKLTPLLKQRVDKAVEAFKQSENPNIKIIASGGKGSDEEISEAQAIANYLVEEAEIPIDKIILEDKSTTTYENLQYSKVCGESEVDSPRFLFVTNNYHVYRTSAYAKKVGLVGDGLGCRTARYYIPSALIREFIALCLRIKWVFVAFYLLLIVALLVSYRHLIF